MRSGTVVNPDLVKIVRSHLKYLAPTEPLGEDASLKNLGLDSMAAVTLLVDIEDEFDVALPDSEIIPATFETVASLWAAVQRVRTTSGRP
jgi:acyl carrier protein